MILQRRDFMHEAPNRFSFQPISAYKSGSLLMDTCRYFSSARYKRLSILSVNHLLFRFTYITLDSVSLPILFFYVYFHFIVFLFFPLSLAKASKKLCCTLDASSSSCHLSPHFCFQRFQLYTHQNRLSRAKYPICVQFIPIFRTYISSMNTYMNMQRKRERVRFSISYERINESRISYDRFARTIAERESVSNEHTFHIWNSATLCYCLPSIQ